MSTDRELPASLAVATVIVLLSPLVGAGLIGLGIVWRYATRAATDAGGLSLGVLVALGLLTILAFWAALIWGIVLLLRCLRGAAASTGRSGKSALDLLTESYLAGRVTRREYDQLCPLLHRRNGTDKDAATRAS